MMMPHIESFIRDLRSEARNLEYLLGNHLDDLSFLAAPAQGKLLYFVDSHELRAYITPRDPEHLQGFMLLAEQSLKSQSGDPPAFEIQLKSQEFLRELLFERHRQTVLLPSHAEEIDEEIAFQEQRGLSERISLLEAARSQLRRLLGVFGATDKEFRRAEKDPAIKRRLVSFFHSAAPALMAVCRPNPQTVMSRVDALVNKSNLVPLNRVDWERFGFDPATCRSLRELRPTHKNIDRWRDVLTTRRDHTYRSNRIDAEALSFLQALNVKFHSVATQGGPRVRAVLVTRAMALIRAARAHENANFVRHPRLLALGTDAQASPPSADRAANTEPEQALKVSLQTYRKQLNVQGRDQEGANEAVQKTVEKLAKAWSEFERARLTFELRSQPEPDTITDNAAVEDDFRRLLEWLRRDADVEELIKNELLSSIRQFGRATFAWGLGRGAEAVHAHLMPLSDPPRTRVVPMVSGAPLPVEFLARSLMNVEGRYLDITDILSDLQADSAECYVAWSMLFACQRRWRLAAIYLNSAIEIANTKVVQPREAEWTRHEVELLRAQISRLGATDDVGSKHMQTPSDRFKWSEKVLSRCRRPRDLRVPMERAAQLLECRLLLADDDTSLSTLRAGFELLCDARTLAKAYQDELMLPRILALGICYYVAACSRPKLWPELAPEHSAQLRDWHAELHRLLTEQRKDLCRDEISLRARALELIGFQCLAPVDDALSPSVPAAPKLLRIPSDLCSDVFEIRDRMVHSKDATARLITNEIEQFARLLEIYQQRELIYAPVWAPYEYERIAGLIRDPALQNDVRSAYERLRTIVGASQRLGVGTHHREDLGTLAADFSRARQAIVDRPAGAGEHARQALFHLSMESCYARLLLSCIAWPQQRDRERELLATEYRAIAESFPEASVPHFRLDTLLSSLGSDRDAAIEAQHALDLVKSDPFIEQKEHWVISTMRRRVAAGHAECAEKLREAMESTSPDVERRCEYIEALWRAFATAYSGYPEEIQTRSDSLFELEACRRTNNIVYYASLILEQPSGEERLRQADFGREQLRQMVEMLHPSGIDQVIDPNLAHTIGYAYDALGDPAPATEAAKRFFTLVGEMGGDPKTDKSLAKAVADAIRWIRRGTDELLTVGSPPTEALLA